LTATGFAAALDEVALLRLLVFDVLLFTLHLL